MKKIDRAYQKLSDFFEVYLPCCAFVVLFVSYVIMILYRYIFNAQINEVYELSMIAFVWTVVLAASYHSRTDEHIMFTILYDKLPKKGKRVMRMLGNGIVIVFTVIILPHAVESVRFLAIKKSSLMKIPFNIIYAPFICYLVLTAIHHSILLIKDAAALASAGKEGKE